MPPTSKYKLPAIILLAGLAAELAFEAYAWLISPVLFGPTLEPANLVKGLSAKFLGLDLSYIQALFIHFFIGTVVFSLTVYVVSKWLQSRYVLGGLVTGLALWFTAQGILAPLLGRAFMMDFGPYTQSSFIGHVGMCLIIGYIFSRAFERRELLPTVAV